ncbi:YheC/YheD family protein [Paenibacillus caui]|uniref:YheC/YheD family endospore coat-associated protein n=1 Tax=Paenibacillus caui TaxID=2873927 RepID=UPI001CA87721|nr:YheC/YheD family protein [Paenibacillus caui]
MPSRKLTLQITNPGLLGDSDILLGAATVKRLKIPPQTPIRMKFGSFEHYVRVIPQSKARGLRISAHLAKKMGISPKTTLRLVYTPSTRTLHLGPVIGVLISRDFPENLDRPFGLITSFCKELTFAGRKQGAFVYFITPAGIEQGAAKIQGWVFEDSWRKTDLPVADVYYNRLNSRKLESMASVQHFMNDVRTRYNSHFFNEKYLDKTEVFDALQKDGQLERYLPESHLHRGLSSLRSMLSKYPVVFLKPIKGSLGKGIIRINRTSDGSYMTLSTQSYGTRKQIHDNLVKLHHSLAGKMKTTRYQIQQGLYLIAIGKRPVDFRALVQKNAQGKWAVTSIVARIAGSQHFVSNLARGGTLSKVKEAVDRSTLPAAIKLKAGARLHKAALEIAEGVDERIAAHFGELGIDLAMDQAGRIWLLEVNSKPSKNDNTSLGENIIRPSVRRLVDYAGYLSGY